MEITFDIYDSVTSTNAVLKEQAEKGAMPGRVVAAWTQTEGRGRLGRSFASPRGGIYLSMLLPADGNLTVTAKAAVAVRRAIEEAADIKTEIKWVNDLLYRGRKVCGILAEAVPAGVVVGIGINFSTRQSEFPPELRDTAISLYNGPEKADSDAMDIVNAVVRNLAELCGQSSGEGSWLEEYRAANIVLGKEVKIFQAGVQTGSGTARFIDDNCALHIDTKNGETVLSSGEVTVRL